MRLQVAVSRNRILIEAAMDPIVQPLALHDCILSSDDAELIEEHLNHLALTWRSVRCFVDI